MKDHEKIERLRRAINTAILESGATMADARRAVNMVVTDLKEIQDIAMEKTAVERLAAMAGGPAGDQAKRLEEAKKKLADFQEYVKRPPELREKDMEELERNFADPFKREHEPLCVLPMPDGTGEIHIFADHQVACRESQRQTDALLRSTDANEDN